MKTFTRFASLIGLVAVMAFALTACVSIGAKFCIGPPDAIKEYLPDKLHGGCPLDFNYTNQTPKEPAKAAPAKPTVMLDQEMRLSSPVALQDVSPQLFAVRLFNESPDQLNTDRLSLIVGGTRYGSIRCRLYPVVEEARELA